jgi:hypothetical protein
MPSASSTRASVQCAESEGLTQAFECGPNPSHSLVFNILEAARSRVEDCLPAYGDLWERPSLEETEKAIEERGKRMERYRNEYKL